MISAKGKDAKVKLHDLWDDHARLLGCRDRHAFHMGWGQGEFTVAQCRDHVQKVLNALHRHYAGNGASHGTVKFVTGNSRSYEDVSTWRINLQDSWALVLENYAWNWAQATYSGSRKTGKFELLWMRVYRTLTLEFFRRGLYLPPTAPPPKQPPSKNELRAKKIAALEVRRVKWEKVLHRAEMAIAKIDRSLRAYQRHANKADQ
jgi:hypothetical protein